MALRHARLGHRATLVVLGTLALSGVGPVAAAGPPPPAAGPPPGAARTLGADRPPAEVVRALGRDLGLTPRQASLRLVDEAEAGARAGLLRNALGERFAGAWLSGTTATALTVATTDRADVAAIEAQGARAVVVGSSLADLTAVKERLDAAATPANTADAPHWYVDAPHNQVVVEAAATSAAAPLLEAAGVEARVAVRVSAIRPRLLEDITGGQAYYIDGSARCTVGFSVTKDQQAGFATAGHCGQPGARTTGHNLADQGTFQASVFPGKDMAWVGVDENWTPTPDVLAENGEKVQVAGSVEALVGASVCRSGSTTGWHCGTIEQHGTSVSYPQGVVEGVTRTTVCAEPGDSGGPYLSGVQAQGVTSGGSGDCVSGGTTFYQPVNALLGEFGLILKTQSGQTGPPAPQDGTAPGSWAAGRVYEAGATAGVGGVTYQCLQSHQAQASWSPPDTPALWRRL